MNINDVQMQLQKPATSFFTLHTLIGRIMSGRFHLNHRIPLTDSMMNTDSTILEYVMSRQMSLVLSITSDNIFCEENTTKQIVNGFLTFIYSERNSYILDILINSHVNILLFLLLKCWIQILAIIFFLNFNSYQSL